MSVSFNFVGVWGHFFQFKGGGGKVSSLLLHGGRSWSMKDLMKRLIAYWLQHQKLSLI